ncbi:hypothetical protein K0M31_017838 [Melipona bicolor]|uniref:Uncharacterized protein n=1 Tax=Melipona bicolor TaxID=60889 RepID=A0AA40G5T9_9HYME|nr:hypothetical protein K0M31_017838 [Melipona bicolor]
MHRYTFQAATAKDMTELSNSGRDPATDKRRPEIFRYQDTAAVLGTQRGFAKTLPGKLPLMANLARTRGLANNARLECRFAPSLTSAGYGGATQQHAPPYTIEQ